MNGPDLANLRRTVARDEANRATRTDHLMTIGILAFGSLLDDPCDELRNATAERRNGFKTPFGVEFARKSSRTRDGAPTLVPFEPGAHVDASVFVLDRAITEDRAKGILYRRETRNAGAPDADAQSKTWIQALRDYGGVDVCLYTAFPANIEPLTATCLAELAIDSAMRPAGREKRDGISYLIAQKNRGITTPLMPEDEAQILAQSEATDLADAWTRARSQR